MITPVILCGGSGTRPWPLSRKSYPKQFVPLVGEQTLFQGSALRMSGAELARPVVITDSDFRFIVTEQLQEVGIDPGAEMKAMAEENRRLKRIYAEMSMQNDLLKEASGKSAKAVSKKRDGQRSGTKTRGQHRAGLPHIPDQRDVLSL